MRSAPVLATRHLQDGIDAQGIEVVAVLATAGDGEHPRLDHAVIGVHDAAWIAHVWYVTAEHFGKTEPFLDLAQDENAAIRRQLAAAVISLPPTGDRPGRKGVASVMVSGRVPGKAHNAVSTTEVYVIPTDYTPLIASIVTSRLIIEASK